MTAPPETKRLPVLMGTPGGVGSVCGNYSDR